MNIYVSKDMKKQFIKYLLNNQSFQMIEIKQILSYLLNDHNLLKRTHFVTNIVGCPRALIITMTDDGKQTIHFYKGSLYSTDGWQVFHDLRLNNDEELYITIHIDVDDRYDTVLELNPYNQKVNEKYEGIKNKRLVMQMNNLKKQIDHALDHNDQELFYYLSLKLKKLYKT